MRIATSFQFDDYPKVSYDDGESGTDLIKSITLFKIFQICYFCKLNYFDCNIFLNLLMILLKICTKSQTRVQQKTLDFGKRRAQRVRSYYGEFCDFYLLIPSDTADTECR